MTDDIRQRFDESMAVLRDARDRLAGRIAEAVDLIVAAYRSGRGVYVFGNGGSAADAQHIAGELVGRFLKERRALKALALSTDTSVLTAIGNDYHFEDVFVRQLEACAAAGDVAIGLSTSGNSANVVLALRRAREMGLKTIAMTGAGGGRCAELADVLLDVPEKLTPRVQEAQMVAYHVLCELVELAVVAGEA
jgi:D-sedoheptulose 7-phosphate isomerase